MNGKCCILAAFLSVCMSVSTLAPQTPILLSAAETGHPTDSVVNGDFEKGSLEGWMTLDGSSMSGTDSSVGVISDSQTYWEDAMERRFFYKEGNYFLRGDGKENSTGSIRSNTFTLGGDGYITFLIGGAASESKGCVKIFEESPSGGKLIKTYTNPKWRDPQTGNTLIRIYDRLGSYIGKNLYFVVQNGKDTEGFAFVHVDDFRASLTLKEVKKLHRDELLRVKGIDDLYKNDILEAYQSYGLEDADFPELSEIVPETVTAYTGKALDLKSMISSYAKARYAYAQTEIPVEVSIDRVTDGDGRELAKNDIAAIGLSEGNCQVFYSLTYSGEKSEDLSFRLFIVPASSVGNDVENGGFESGNLSGWTPLNEEVWKKEGNTFCGIVSEETYWGENLPYNQEGNFHLNGWSVTDDENISWGVRSSVFTLGGSGFISLRMGGAAAQVRIYKADGTSVGTYSQNRFCDDKFPFIAGGGSWADMGTYYIDLHEYIGEQLYIELWDRPMSSGGWKVAFFDDVQCYHKAVPDVANGFDTVKAPLSRNEDGSLSYGDVSIPWTKFLAPSHKKNVLSLSFDGDTGFFVSNDSGQKEKARIVSNFESPVYQDAPVEPYRPKGVKGKSLNFDGYSNSLYYNEEVSGSKLTVDAYVCPRVFTWSAPQDSKESHIPEVIVGSYDTAEKKGFLLGVTKHGYLTFRIGTGSHYYTLLGNSDSTLPTYTWSRVSAVFDGDAGKMSLYLNGSPAGSIDIPKGSKIESAESRIYVGRGSEAASYEVFDKTYFPGLMDEISVSLSAKSAKEIARGGYALPNITYDKAMTPKEALEGDYYRPQYHAAPSGNWMNEPHALFQYKGMWHLFYQFAPAGPYWQTISWGHWVSSDMADWKFVKEAVIPTEGSVSPDAVWTGNVIFSADGKPLLLITAGDDARTVNGSNQHVGLVRADNYEDPTLTDWSIIGYARAQEAGMGVPGEFRDAQAFRIGNERYMVVGGADEKDTPSGRKQVGVAHIFKTQAKSLSKWETACRNGSLNGMGWEYMGSLMSDNFYQDFYPEEYGDVWEMPNLVPLPKKDGTDSGKYLFVFSPQHGDNEVWYYIGEFDKDSCRFTPDFSKAQLMDLGDNIFTGPTVYQNEDKKVYICSIMQDGRTPSEHKDAGWAHFAGLPRELYLMDDGSLGIAHINTSSLEGDTLISFQNLSVQEANEKLSAIHGDLLKIDFAFDGLGTEDAGFFLKQSGSDNAGSTKFCASTSKISLDEKGGDYDRRESLSGTIYMDKASVEAYVDDRICISGVKYLRGNGLSVFGGKDTKLSMTVTEMRSLKGSALRKGDTFQAGKGKNKLTYQVTKKDRTVKVIEISSKTKNTDITIPATVKAPNGKTFKVTVIAEKAFKNAGKIKSIVIGKNVKLIGSDAFTGCGKLKKLTIRTTLLTKKNVKGSLKGSSIQKISVPKSVKKKYITIFAKKNSGRKVSVI